ncbi:DUF1877 domain-containing protein [Streptacidiphilus sp. PAMC 29251]
MLKGEPVHDRRAQLLSKIGGLVGVAPFAAGPECNDSLAWAMADQKACWILGRVAVTQQLARVPAQYLDDCRSRAVVSPDDDPGWDPPLDDICDLDWAPALLERACGHAQIDPRLLDAVRCATSGDPVVDIAYLDHPAAVGDFGPAPTALAPPEVTRTAAALQSVDFTSVLATLPDEDRQIAGVLGPAVEGLTGAKHYLARYFMALCDFYQGAADRGLFVVSWWD